MFALWLGSYPDGDLRERRLGQDYARRLPAYTWLKDMLDEHGGPDFHKTVLSAGGRCTGKRVAKRGVDVHSLLQVSREGCVYNDGVLTAWTRQAKLQREYHGWPLDDYEVRVSRVALLRGSTKVFSKASRHVGSGGCAGIAKRFPLFVGR